MNLDSLEKSKASAQTLSFHPESLPHVDLEWALRGDDVVFHFFPKDGGARFPAGFLKVIEKPFVGALGPHADVRADYVNLEEGAAILRVGETRSTGEPRESLCVEVIGGATTPSTLRYLTTELFEKINQLDL